MELTTIQDALNAEPGVYIVHEPAQIAVLTITRDGWRTIIDRQELGMSIRLHQLVGRFAADDVLRGVQGDTEHEPAGELSTNHVPTSPELVDAAPAAVHTQELPVGAFVCPDCNKTFSKAQGLQVHRARMHSVRTSAPDAPRMEAGDPVVHAVHDADALADGVLTAEADALLAAADASNPTLPQSSVGLLGVNGHAGTVEAM